MDEDTLKGLLNFIDLHNIDDTHIISQIEDHLETYLRDIINSNDLDIDYGKHISYSYDPEGYADHSIDTTGIESEVAENLNSFLENFNELVLKRIGFNTSNIVSSLDIENMAENYIENQTYDDDERINVDYNNSSSSQDDIDAIFERS